MKMRPLIIDEILKEQVAQVEQFARANHYIPGETGVPGDDPRYCLTTQFGYRCVFSYTQTRQGLYRDLSISVDEPGKYPNEFAAYTIAECFGFTGWDQATIVPPPEDWLITKDMVWDAIRLCQRIGD